MEYLTASIITFWNMVGYVTSEVLHMDSTMLLAQVQSEVALIKLHSLTDTEELDTSLLAQAPRRIERRGRYLKTSYDHEPTQANGANGGREIFVRGEHDSAKTREVENQLMEVHVYVDEVRPEAVEMEGELLERARRRNGGQWHLHEGRDKEM